MGMAKYVKDLRRLVDREAPGSEVSILPGGHIGIRVSHAGRSRVVYCSATPSDNRSMVNTRAEVRRARKRLEQEDAGSKSTENESANR